MFQIMAWFTCSTSYDQLKVPPLPLQVLHVFMGSRIAAPKVSTSLTDTVLASLYRMFQNCFAMLEVAVVA